MKNYVLPNAAIDSTDLLEKLISKRSQIRQMADFYLKELQKLDSAYKILSGTETDIMEGPTSIKRVKWTTAAIQCLQYKNSLLKTVDILQFIFKDNPEEIESTYKRRLYITGLSVALSKLIQKSKICKIEITGEKGHLYGLREWFMDDQKTLKEEMKLSFQD